MNFWTLIKYLPVLLKLIEALKNKIDQIEKDRLVKEDIKTITDAINEKDSDKLSSVLNSRM